MKKIIFLTSFFLIFSLNVFSQPSEINLNGYNIFYYPDGSISSEGFLKDGKPDGYWKTFYPSNVMKSEGNRKNFLLDSIWVFYDEKADTTEKIDYLMGKKNGYYFKYNNNNVISKELYLNDVQQGMSFYYYDSGNLYQKINFKDGFKQGEAFEFSEEGFLIAIYEYRYGNIISRERLNRYDSSGKKTGLWKEFYDNGNVKSEANYLNGILNGYVKDYDQDGKIIKSERYLNGELVVVSAETPEEETKIEIKTELFESGKIKESGSFTETNIPVGVHRTYNESGKVVNSITYDDLGIILSDGIVDDEGLKQGKWVYYYETGEKKSEGEFIGDLKTGSWKYFYSNGNNLQTGVYVKDKPHGEWVWYYESGKILRKENFVNGREDGSFVELSENGDTIVSGNYYDGQKNGLWKHRIGDEYWEGEYKYDLKEGIWNYYYFPEMILKSTGRFVQGLEQDKFKFYYNSGKIKEEGEYVAGKKHKTWRIYDLDGYVITTIIYNLGEIQKIDGVDIQ